MHSRSTLSNWLSWRDVGSRGELGVRVVGAAAKGVHIQQFSRGCTRDIYSADDGKPFTSGLPPSMVSAETPARLSR